MNKKLLMILVISILVTSAASAQAMQTIAVNTTNPSNGNITKKTTPSENKNPSSAEKVKPDKEQAKADAALRRLDMLKAKATQVIDKRIAFLNAQATKLQSNKRLTEQERAAIKQDFDDVIDTLNTKKEEILAATDLETAKTMLKEAIFATRTNAVIVPKIRAIALTMGVKNAIERIEKIYPKVTEAITKLPAEKQENATTLLNTAKASVSAAKLKIEAAKQEFEKMQPGQDTTAAKQHLAAGKTLVKEAHAEIKKASANLREILALLKTENVLAEEEQEQEQEANQGETTNNQNQNSNTNSTDEDETEESEEEITIPANTVE
jgi:hypothetical protein